MKSLPQFLFRPIDSERWTLQRNGNYTMDSSKMIPKYEETYETLISHGFTINSHSIMDKIESEKWDIPSWDEWFLRMVYDVASKSKDKSSKIGSVIVNNNQIIKIGYNGFPIGINDTIVERHDRPLKYKFTSHSEINAILFAARDGAKTDGCTIYTNGISCVDCARAIIQAGIKKVIYHKQFQDKWDEYIREQWNGHKEITQIMFDESKVELICYDGILNVKSLIAGHIFNL